MTIGDNAWLDQCVVRAMAFSRGNLVLKPVLVGEDCSIGCKVGNGWEGGTR